MATTVTIADIANKIIKETDGYKLPKDPTSLKSMSLVADELYTTQQDRYALNKAVEALGKKESLLREHLIDNLKKDSTGIAGRIARASIKMKTVVQVEEWPKVYEYILKHARKDSGAWSLLQKRIGEGAVKEIWESGKTIPGVKPLDVPTVSLNKVG